jgi:hypothetical protein
MKADEIKALKSTAVKNSLTIAFLYVGLGTVTVMSVYPASPLYGDWVYVGLLLTLPVSIISFAVMFAEPNGYFLVLIVQSVTFLFFWLILYRYLLKRYKRRLR